MAQEILFILKFKKFFSLFSCIIRIDLFPSYIKENFLFNFDHLRRFIEGSPLIRSQTCEGFLHNHRVQVEFKKGCS